MTSTHRGISRALLVLALSGAGTGIVGAVSVAAHADGLTGPTPLPTTDPTSLVSGVTGSVPLLQPTDSPSPQPTDTTPTDGGSAPNGDATSTGSSGTNAPSGQSTSGPASTGQASSGVVAAATKSTSMSTGSNAANAKSAAVTSPKQASAPKGLDLVKTAGGLTQGAVTPGLATPDGSAPVAMTMLMHGLSLPDLPALPALDGSSISSGVGAQAPIVAPPPMAPSGVSGTEAGNLSAESYRPTSSATPAGTRSPVAPALFALVAAAVAAGVAKVRIRWGRR